MQQKIRWGVLGYAGIAKNHVIPAMVKAKNSIPYAIASRSGEKLAEAKEAFGFAKAYESYEALLRDPEVDAVYIPLPNRLHREWTIKAAEHGKHILCEKPLGLDDSECQEMMEAAQRHGVKLMEAFMYRFTTRTKKMLELLGQGIIGEVRHINSTYRFYLEDDGDIRVSKEMAGGSLRDVGCYPINIIGLIVGDEPESVSVQATEFQGVDHSLSAVLKYKNGVIATASSGFNSQATLLTEINGTKGSMIVRDAFIDTDTPILVVKDGAETAYPVERCERYVLEVEEFADAVLQDRQPALSLEEAVRNNRIIARILKAAGL